ncbi:MAG: ribulose-phosphate 3-epimerase [Bacilli bacterium]|nr:ribulose-phosphate 3-epimerase [Bacilli bacterium]
MKVSVSILKEENNIKNAVKKLNDTSADYIHLDIMDNTFTNTSSKFVLSDFRNINNSKKYDIHLMSTNLDYQIEEAIKLNPEFITFHVEATKDYKKYINKIKENNIKVGLAINPETNIDDYKDIFTLADMILVMSVAPGKGGQSFIEEIVQKTRLIRENYKDKIISIDGGINDITAKKVFNYVDILVSGNFITSKDDYEKGILLLKNN